MKKQTANRAAFFGFVIVTLFASAAFACETGVAFREWWAQTPFVVFGFLPWFLLVNSPKTFDEEETETTPWIVMAITVLFSLGFAYIFKFNLLLGFAQGALAALIGWQISKRVPRKLAIVLPAAIVCWAICLFLGAYGSWSCQHHRNVTGRILIGD